MDRSDQGEVIATARPTPGRRILALTALIALGAGAVYLGFTRDAPPLAKALLVALGATGIWVADGLRKATAGQVELTADVLRDGDGTVIAQVRDIAHVERGVFAFKPSNGFLLRTRSARPKGWRMGLWWRLGRRVGIGGMMPVHQTKAMAEQIVTLIQEKSDSAE